MLRKREQNWIEEKSVILTILQEMPTLPGTVLLLENVRKNVTMGLSSLTPVNNARFLTIAQEGKLRSLLFLEETKCNTRGKKNVYVMCRINNK